MEAERWGLEEAKDAAEERPCQGALLGIGQPLLDMVARVGQDLLDRYSLRVNNFALEGAEQRGLYDELARDHQVEYVAGGSVMNSMRVAQWLCRTPGVAQFMGSVGDDAFGKRLELAGREADVDLTLQKVPGVPTGLCAVLVHGEERALCTRLDASKACMARLLEGARGARAMGKAEIVYMGSFLITIENGAAAALAIAQEVSRRGKVLAFNLSAPFLVDSLGAEIDALLPFVDILFGNETEARAMGARLGLESIDEVALRLSALPKRNGARGRVVVFTQGPDPCVVAEGGAVTHYPVPPVRKISDTNGAGDAFVGGYLACYLQEPSTAKCVGKGHEAARHVLQRPGCALPPRPLVRDSSSSALSTSTSASTLTSTSTSTSSSASNGPL